MSRYIDSDILAGKLVLAWKTAEQQGRKDITEVLSDIVIPALIKTPTEDVVEVVKGKWKEVQTYGENANASICECSHCKDTVWVYKDQRQWNFCPHCGADMRGDRE